MLSTGRGCTAVGTTFSLLAVWPACAKPARAATGSSLSRPAGGGWTADREAPAALAQGAGLKDTCTVLQVVAAGWTVSPLLPKYTHDSPSAESLVTLVFKVDLQGWLSRQSGSLLGRLLACLQGTPLGQAVRNRYLGPILMSLVTLRDQVRWHARLNVSAQAIWAACWRCGGLLLVFLVMQRGKGVPLSTLHRGRG